MEIRSSHQSAQRVTATHEGQAPRFQPGQLLEARVLTPSTGTPASRGIQVQVGSHVLELQSQLTVKTGEILRLRVITAEPRLELELIQQQKTHDSTQSRAELINQSLKQFIPRQQGLQYLTAILNQVQEQKSLPSGVRETLLQLLAAVPRSGDLASSQRLAEAVRSSGLFLEATLAAGKTIPDNDLKLLWLSLLARVRAHVPQGQSFAPLPSDNQTQISLPFLLSPVAQARTMTPRGAMKQDSLDQLILRLFGMAESAVSRISLHQLATSESQQQGESRWKMEIPLAFPNNEFGVMQLFIEKEAPESRTKKASGVEEQAWTLSLALDMPGLGPLHARLKLRGQVLETRIIAERGDTVKRLNEQLPQLQDRLRQQGLEIACLECHEGKPDHNSSAPSLNMLDIKV